MACRASLEVSAVVVRIYGLVVDDMVVVPATAESTREVIELLTVSPQVPDSSPWTGRAKPKSDVDAVVMMNLY
tara:strand:- start:4520 stop:4738 length:219 start_codon:yes stop_codon:yes gene_type:complete